ncbi:hypothetical protein ADUPG1_013506 [Aduncisulcus paluster]|uniref:Uncharacterized protein n=1 Tax=Aduncisulcus paluster TaxID=2918883 RepID=A0ABQ5K369_9EUKA|nr:hypothetical protein ADUPG1_013506 [Aduncisulcus paluster]
MMSSPDLISVKFICSDALTDNDAIWVLGAPRISKYRHITGQSMLISISGVPHPLEFERKGDIHFQITKENFARELTKFIAAFLPPTQGFLESMLKDENVTISTSSKLLHVFDGPTKHHTQCLWLPYGFSHRLIPNPPECKEIFTYQSNFFGNLRSELFEKPSPKRLQLRNYYSAQFQCTPYVSQLFIRPFSIRMPECGSFDGNPIVKGVIQMCAMRIVHFINTIHPNLKGYSRLPTPSIFGPVYGVGSLILQPNQKEIETKLIEFRKYVPARSIFQIWKEMYSQFL